MAKKKVVCVGEIDCACSIKKTHEFPCFHVIKAFEENPGYIPLSSIHVRWKTLDIQGPYPPDSQLDHKPIMHAIEEKMNTVTPWEKHNLFVKLREICVPSMTTLNEPIKKLKERGNPKGSGNRRKVVVEESTRRDLSFHEHVERAINEYQDTTKPKPVKQNVRISSRVSCLPTVTTEYSYMMRYMKFIPMEVQAHMSSIVNVAPDGNCGYRVIAYAIEQSEEGLPMVRRRIRGEMVEKVDQYKDLIKCDEFYYKCLSSLDYQKGSCFEDKWFDSFMGWAVCNVYDVILTILDTTFGGSQTFLPTYKAPTKWPPLHVWTIKYKDHFVYAKLKDSFSMPRVSKEWKRVRSDTASQWHSKLRHRFMK